MEENSCGLIQGAVLAFAWKERGKNYSQGSCIPSELQIQFRNAAGCCRGPSAACK